MKLYTNPLSGHAHRAEALLEILNVPYEAIFVDLAAGEQRGNAFTDINPLGQLPFMVDGDVALRDSTAILVYVASTYDKSRSWLPTDPVQTSKVQEWLATSTKEVFEGPCGARISKFFGVPVDYDTAVSRTHVLFEALFEPHLATNDWLVPGGPTIADISNYGYIAAAPEAGVDLTTYPNVVSWLRRCEAIGDFPKMPTIAEVMSAANSSPQT